ncbi:translation initiation factor IF-2 [Streptococcus zalophi]|uniref:translation initiation factor IF-2 n=1 Tax=Streptococcus zalophi TaxID=640031 RepID=UPI00215D1BB2|nr:translation initiation factor IF-2 [Streptococcus zalophi]MCR8967134.1 translation initiation factor IF-2 [Streptococcus zalophi]
MSKKRLHEIAKEIGKTSKEVVEQAKSLGFAVKTHSSTLDEADVKILVSSFSKAANKPLEKKETTASETRQKVNEEQLVKSKETDKTVTKKTTSQVQKVDKKEVAQQETIRVKPKSRNFKAEREAKAKAEAERRRKAKENATSSDSVNASNRPKERTQNKAKFNSRRFDNQRSGRKDNYKKKEETKVEKPTTPKIDFKARAAALKAEQNAEYSRQSESRFRQEQQSKIEKTKREKEAREKRLNSVKTEVKKVQEVEPVIEAKSIVGDVVAPPKQSVDTRRKKQARQEKLRHEAANLEDGPKQGKNKKNWNNHNQVRNQRNSNWNTKKKSKKGRNNKDVAPKPVTERKFHELPKEFEYTAGMTIVDIAKRIKREPAEIVKKLFMMGVMATQNQSLDADTIELLMVDYGIEAHQKIEVDNADIERFFTEEGYLNPENMVERAPVVTIMGHVDHGKTTLLDTLRHSRVATGEAGGITQHIGAYQIEENGKKITFLDTPGHAAFTSMRARGASVTDITILIVAADDGVMPQTIEAINHSKAAGVPIIVAINKIDKPDANPERVIGELAEHGVMSTAWGGDSEFVEISAKFGKNLDELLETVLLVAEIQELKADPTVRAIGTVIEARLDKGKGAIATLLVQQGTLNVQDPIVVGNTFGRVRAMTNDLGRRVKTAPPSTPVSITGLNETPMAGDHFAVYEDEKAARAAGEERAKRALIKQRQNTHRVSLENLFDTLKEGQVKSVNVIIKADVQGSVEALAASLVKIDVEGVKVTVVHAAVGAINESDITLAAASNALIIGFNVRPTPQARQQAETDEVDIRLHSIIYKVIEEVEDAMKGMLDPEYKEKILGEAVIRETFAVSKVGTIGGFMVTSGKITRDSSVRVIRDSVVVFDGKLASLKHFKDDVKEVTNGREGGLMIEKYNDLQVDDLIEAYVMEEIKR